MTKSKAIIKAIVEATDESDGPPTKVHDDGTKRWYVNDLLHRDGGPAIVRASGSKLWYQHGKLHRDDGPAVEWSDGGKEWYQRGKLNRLDGPAIESSTGHKEWWANNREFTEDEFIRFVDPVTGEVLVPPGKKLKYG